MNALPSIVSKFPGTCACGARFSAGVKILWSPATRRAVGCPSCPAAAAPVAVDLLDGLDHDMARFVKERPGCHVAVLGLADAERLATLGLITIKGNKCYPAAGSAAIKPRSARAIANDREYARLTLLGKWGAMA